MSAKKTITIFLLLSIIEIVISRILEYYFGEGFDLYSAGVVFRSLSLLLLIAIFYQYASKNNQFSEQIFGLRKVNNRNIGSIICFGGSFVAFLFSIKFITNPEFYSIIISSSTKLTLNTNIQPLNIPFMILDGVVVHPFWEELLFRALLVNGLEPKWGKWKMILLSSILFSLRHIDISRMPYMFILGIGLGWITSTTKSIIPSFICHSLFNLIYILFFIFFFYPEKISHISLGIGIFALLLFGGLMIISGLWIKNNQKFAENALKEIVN